MQNAKCKIGRGCTFGCTFFVRLKLIKRLPAGMSQSDCRVCKQTSRSSRGTRVRESACTKRFDGSAVKRSKTLFTQSPPPLRGAPSRREPWEKSPPHIRLFPQSAIHRSLLWRRACRKATLLVVDEEFLRIRISIKNDPCELGRSSHGSGTKENCTVLYSFEV